MSLPQIQTDDHDHTVMDPTISPIGSDASDGSLTSVNSAEFAERVNTLRASVNPKELQSTAKKLIAILAANAKEDKLSVGTSTLEAHRVLQAMLDNALDWNDEAAVKYCAAAISACARTKDGVDMTASSLKELAHTWVSHFLYPSTHSHKTQKNENPSKAATPTADQTFVALERVKGSKRPDRLRKQILERDGYECLVTGAISEDHPSVIADFTTRHQNLECAHILRRAVAEVGKSGSEQFKGSAVQCFDILRNYCGLSEETLSKLDEIIDYPENGFMLWEPVHSTFDQFCWTLIPHESGPNRYKVKELVAKASLFRFPSAGGGAEYATELEFVEFKDHRDNKGKAIALPDPLFFKIHAAVAGILKMSGAGKFFDEVLEKYEGDPDAEGVPAWDDVVRNVNATFYAEVFQTQIAVR